MSETLKTMMREYVTRNAPAEKEKRRAKRRAKSIQAPLSAKVRRKDDAPSPEKPTRYITVVTRDEVLIRDDYQCTYIGSDGVRCAQTQYLQYDHILPFAKGGESTKGNLRLLCGKHNRLEAKAVFGAAVPDVIRELRVFYQAVPSRMR